MDVVIRPDWLDRRMHIHLPFKNLTIYRPATIDLILTKMMRDDPEDLMDIEFLLGRETFSIEVLQAAFSAARMPPPEEFQEIFARVQPKVLEMARAMETQHSAVQEELRKQSE